MERAGHLERLAERAFFQVGIDAEDHAGNDCGHFRVIAQIVVQPRAHPLPQAPGGADKRGPWTAGFRQRADGPGVFRREAQLGTNAAPRGLGGVIELAGVAGGRQIARGGPQLQVIAHQRERREHDGRIAGRRRRARQLVRPFRGQIERPAHHDPGIGRPRDAVAIQLDGFQGKREPGVRGPGAHPRLAKHASDGADLARRRVARRIEQPGKRGCRHGVLPKDVERAEAEGDQYPADDERTPPKPKRGDPEKQRAHRPRRSCGNPVGEGDAGNRGDRHAGKRLTRRPAGRGCRGHINPRRIRRIRRIRRQMRPRQRLGLRLCRQAHAPSLGSRARQWNAILGRVARPSWQPAIPSRDAIRADGKGKCEQPPAAPIQMQRAGTVRPFTDGKRGARASSPLLPASCRHVKYQAAAAAAFIPAARRPAGMPAAAGRMPALPFFLSATACRFRGTCLKPAPLRTPLLPAKRCLPRSG